MVGAVIVYWLARMPKKAFGKKRNAILNDE